LKKIIWKIQITKAPAAVKYCKRCGSKTEFMSSGLFRVNAQQKNLDVWLIYKCTACDTTWNLTILSRVNPCSIPTETLHQFHENNFELAVQYAADINLVKKNGAEPCIPEIEIHGEKVDFSVPTLLHLQPQYPMAIKVSALLRRELNLSRTEFDRLCDEGKISCVSGQNLKKSKLSDEVIIAIE
jgi:Uncharacterized protein conserved in bacteria